MATIEKPLQIAGQAHAGQGDKEGLPYHFATTEGRPAPQVCGFVQVPDGPDHRGAVPHADATMTELTSLEGIALRPVIELTPGTFATRERPLPSGSGRFDQGRLVLSDLHESD